MTDTPEAWETSQASLDEILYRYPPTLAKQLEVRNGVTRMIELITFADGSSLAITAQVSLPPLQEMTPTQIDFLKLSGERGQKLDDGTSEAMNLARLSGAMRFLEKISGLLDEIPECEKSTCPSCRGGRYHISCYGQGCPECAGSGVCPECSGHGLVADGSVTG